jgi:hypothetical protein
MPPSFQRELLFPSAHGTTVRLTVAALLAMLGSAVSAMVAAFSVITVPAGAVTFTVNRTVHVVFRAMAPFWLQTIGIWSGLTERSGMGFALPAKALELASSATLSLVTSLLPKSETLQA